MEKNPLIPQEYELPPGFHEPDDGSVRYFPWGAMPTNIYRDDVISPEGDREPFDSAIRQRQNHIQGELRKLYEIPPAGTPEAFAELVATDTFSGEQRRDMTNYNSYKGWQSRAILPTDARLQEEMFTMEDGTATVDEILDVALGTELESFELGKVTHPYRRRFEYVEPFRAHVNQAILNHGGLLLPQSVTPYRSIGVKLEYRRNELVPRGFELAGLIVRYKRDVGVINTDKERVRIVERQLAGFRVDEASRFDQEILREMRAALPADDEWRELNKLAKGNAELHEEMRFEIYHRVMDESGCRAYVEDKVQNNSLEPFVVPLSTTIYGYKEPVMSPGFFAHDNIIHRGNDEATMLVVHHGSKQ